MEITINRRPSTEIATIGQLLFGNSHQSFTCEDIVRPPGVKIYGKTAIPAGRYRIIINRSNRFSTLAGHDVFLPLLLAVPGFEGCRIHPGDPDRDYRRAARCVRALRNGHPWSRRSFKDWLPMPIRRAHSGRVLVIPSNVSFGLS